MKKIKLIVSAFLMLFFLSSAVHAATMTIDISGLDATTPVEGFTIWLDVSGFTLDSGATMGDAIPAAVGSFGWVQDNFALTTTGDQLRMGFSDWDNLMLSMDNPLVDGTMVSFDYTGTITGVALVQIFDQSNDWYALGDITLGSMDASNISFMGPAAVPIPGAIWLLGSALIGILGIKRKFR